MTVAQHQCLKYIFVLQPTVAQFRDLTSREQMDTLIIGMWNEIKIILLLRTVIIFIIISFCYPVLCFSDSYFKLLGYCEKKRYLG